MSGWASLRPGVRSDRELAFLSRRHLGSQFLLVPCGDCQPACSLTPLSPVPLQMVRDFRSQYAFNKAYVSSFVKMGKQGAQ